MRIGIDVVILRERARGVGYYLINILENFVQITKNDRFYLYSPKPIQYNFNQSQNLINRFGTMPVPGSFWLQTQGKSYVVKDKIDIFYGTAHVLPIKLPSKIKTILAIHDLVSIYYPNTMANYNRFIHNLFFKPSIKRADHIVTMSEYTKKSIVECFDIAPDKITVIYEGVSKKFRPHQKDEILSALARYEIKNPYILSVGTIEPRKNYSLLLKAFKQLNSDLDLVIVGKKGWKSQEIFDTINELKLHEKVKILGYINENDMPYLYNGANCFVFPSIYEGFGLPVIEAMACGTPVIASNASSLPEVAGDAAVLVNPYDVSEIAYAIKVLLSNRNKQKEMIEKGFENVKRFTWEKAAQELITLFTEVYKKNNKEHF